MRTAAALLAVLMWGPLGPVAALHDPADDPTCAPHPLDDANPRPSVELAYDRATEPHCAVCHWLSGCRVLVTTPALPDAGEAPSFAVLPLTVAIGDHPVGLRPPARSPPALARFA